MKEDSNPTKNKGGEMDSKQKAPSFTQEEVEELFARLERIVMDFDNALKKNKEAKRVSRETLDKEFDI